MRVVKEEVLVTSVRVPEGRRPLSEANVARLVSSIRDSGLINAITISNSSVLITGFHRLEAFRRLGMKHIPAERVGDDVITNKLIELDENLMRENLSALEEAVAIARRKELYEARFPETKKGEAQGTGMRRSAGKYLSGNLSPRSFTEDTAEKLGVHIRTVERSAQIGRSLSEESIEALRGTALEDKKSVLLEIARHDQEQQSAVIARELHRRQEQEGEEPWKQSEAPQIAPTQPRPRDRWDRSFSMLEATVAVMERAGSKQNSLAQMSQSERVRRHRTLRIVLRHLAVWDTLLAQEGQ